jgi:hypothetical protein
MDFQRFYDFTAEYADFFDDFKVKEEEKFKALYSRDPKRIDLAFNEHIKMGDKVQDFETRRIALLSEFGEEGKTLKEIISTFDGNERTKLLSQYDRLSAAVNVVREFNKRSLEFAQMNIDIVNEINGVFTDSTVYDASGNQHNKTTRPTILNKQA